MLSALLHSTSIDTNNDMPLVVFLHGLLGSGEDWQGVIERLPLPSLTIDLPGHGQSVDVAAVDFDHTCHLINLTLAQYAESGRPLFLVGYSLGGRISMYGLANHYFSSFNLIGSLIEGGNFGLANEADRQHRLQHDTQWANRFRTEPIEQVLLDWYHQRVFSSLNDEQRQTLVTKRSVNLGESIANMLLSTSLGKQPYLLTESPHRKELDWKKTVHYVCGGKDEKFKQLARTSQLAVTVIEKAGHNVHLEAPDEFSQLIHRLVTQRLGYCTSERSASELDKNK
ncbi:2-succinyl-6-hydroxy-2,4-cyclohexadiene-1-carboxylate synthase [Vibrio maerlii]|uniref:2-succinyl-6-hydroxy-2, 4-cyclohexadiene-1-carboxylate synthase n=1 Tax=Vibrio maerlii TaxID=2231648 RepID=UPI000E3CCDA5|nr:2-succinyl-6-hydroxy-2,4-cyclohexadiene-1-carboxylate synthase [Vibrio maerlii]